MLKNVTATTNTVFICVDWSFCGQHKLYIPAAHNIPQVGQVVAQFINDIILEKLQIPLQNVTLIGHSMGCHAAGLSGRFLQTAFNKQLNHIVGIDCAGPYFKHSPQEERIHCKDAKIVTNLICSYVFGAGSHILGTHNYKINNGGNQPACAEKEKCQDGLESIKKNTASCSHFFCCNIIADLLVNMKNEYFASRCNCFNKCDEMESQSCPLSLSPEPHCLPGLFSVHTNSEFPYQMGEAGAKLCNGCNECYSCPGRLGTVLSYSSDGNYCYKDCTALEV